MKFTLKVLGGNMVGDIFFSLKQFSKSGYLCSQLQKISECNKFTKVKHQMKEGHFRVVLCGSAFSTLDCCPLY